MKRRGWSLGIALLVTGLIAPPGTATADPDVLTLIATQVLTAPHVVTGADGRSHLEYEIRLTSRSRSAVTLESVQARSSGGAALATLSGAGLASRVRSDAGKDGPVIESGAGGTIFMDVTLARGRKLPSRVVHRFKLLVQPANSPPQRVSFTAAQTAVVSTPPVVIAPPLRGARWVAASGCCVLNEHRGAILPINGTLYLAERFAIDFIRLTPDNRMFSGPVDELGSYSYFGSKVHSVAAGRVIRIQTGQPQHVPGRFPEGTTVQNAGGNYIVVRIAPRHYAFYGHMQSPSIKVRVGDSVTRGQVIGLLGNSGNSGGPHLHFHVMDGPSPLASSGLPFEFTSFTGHGQMTEEDTLLSGDPMPIDPRALVGRHRNQMPLTDQLLSFP